MQLQPQPQYQYTTQTYKGEKAYRKGLERMSAQGWEVVNAETIPIRKGCLAITFWIILSIITVGILPLIVWLIMGRQVRVIVQYRKQLPARPSSEYATYRK